MATIGQLIRAPELIAALASPVLAGLDRVVRRSVLVETLDAAENAPADTLVVLTSAASREAVGYRLDVGIRRCATRRIAGLCVVGTDGAGPSRTAVALAQHAGIALLMLASHADLAALLVAIQRELAGDASSALAAASRALSTLDELATTFGQPEDLIRATSMALGCPVVTVRPPADDGLSVETTIDGRRVALTAPGGAQGEETTRLLVLHRLCELIRQNEEARQLAEQAPIQTRAELLTELLLTEHVSARGLVERARILGIPIDGWHVVLRIEMQNLTEIAGPDEIRAYHLAQLAMGAAMEAARAGGGMWQRAGAGSVVFLIRSERFAPQPNLQGSCLQTAHRVISRLIAQIPGLSVTCGIGGVHVGVSGLQTSALEAKYAAVAARASGRDNDAAAYDAVGLGRLLLQWYTLDDARDVVARLLAPLDRLGAARATEAIRTLRAYLDANGSLNRSAQILRIHRNTVTYRVQRYLELLNIDLDDPDQRLMLHLACRAKEL